MPAISTQYHLSDAFEPLYISILVICMIIAVRVYGRVQSNIARESVTKSFQRIISVYMVYISVDMMWAAFAFHTSNLTMVMILEYIESGLLSLFTFCWFLFAEHYIRGFVTGSRRTTVLFALPYIATIFTTGIYVINEIGLAGNGGLPKNLLFMLNDIPDLFYLLFALCHTLLRMFREKYKARRHRYFVIIECIIYPAIGAGFSFFIYTVPYIILGILPSIIAVLIDLQNANIYTDALTRINNRYRVDEYLDQNWEHCSEKKPIAIYLIDIDKFKMINDRYGHLEGDRVLVALADSMKKMACEGMLIGRFGGDEFILIDSENHDPEEIRRELRQLLKETAAERQFGFPVTISIGYAACTNPLEDMKNVKARADASLYEDKKRQGIVRAG
jgi:diguanylate cyclase (GGDEF)-like protein